MVIIGADLHKRTPHVVAVDDNGRKLAESTVARDAGRAPRAPPLGGAVRRSGAGRSRTAATCRAACRARPGARRRGGRPGAAEAHGGCPPVRPRAGQERPDRRARGRPGGAPRTRPAGGPLDGPERELRLLVDHREDLVAERTRAIRTACAGTSTSSIPATSPARAASTGADVLRRPRASVSPTSTGTVARIARDLVVRIRELTADDRRSRARDRAAGPRRSPRPCSRCRAAVR